MEPRWYAVQTKPRWEEPVRNRLLQRCHMEVFLPKTSLPKRRRNRRVMAVEILFPSYLFVRMSLEPAPWYAVKWTPGVKRIVGTGDVPVPVPDEAIWIIKERCVDGEMIPWQPAYRRGTAVRITHGPFAGLIGILDQLAPKRERIKVLLNLFGTQARVEVDVVDIEQAG